MISVIVPAFNAASTLSACLHALGHQDFPRNQYEVIVVSDGSTDETASIAQAAGAHVICIPHSGPAVARNAGVAQARGDIILFTDSDCEPAPDWITQMTRPFADPGVTGVKGTYRTRQREVIARLSQCEFEERYERLERQPSIDFVDAHAAAFRAEALRQAGGFDPAFPHANNEDVDLSYRLTRAGRKLVFNRRAFVYHRHRTSWMTYLRLKAKRGYWRMIVYRLHPAKALRDSYTPQLLKVQVLLMGLCIVMPFLAWIWPVAWWVAGVCLCALLASSVPFASLVWRQDAGIVAWTPLFVCGRALAFAIGVASGLVGMLIFRPALPAQSDASSTRAGSDGD